MTKQKDRVNIYVVRQTWCNPVNKFSLIQGSAIETNEMFICIEPVAARNAFGATRVFKSDYMRTAQGAIDNEIRRMIDILRCYKQNVKDKEKDILCLQNLRDIEVGIDLKMEDIDYR